MARFAEPLAFGTDRHWHCEDLRLSFRSSIRLALAVRPHFNFNLRLLIFCFLRSPVKELGQKRPSQAPTRTS